MSKMKLIDGKALSQEILEQIHFHSSIDPVLAIIRANDDESSARYIAHKSIQAEELGIRVQGLEFQKGTTATELIKLIDELNSNDEVHGILVQLPLFPELEADRMGILNAISPDKDVDGLTAINQGFAAQGDATAFLPATVVAILECLKSVSTGAGADTEQFSGDDADLKSFLSGKQITIINHSSLIGRPLTMALLNHNATVTVAHKFTNNLEELTRASDIVVTAAGQPGLLTADSFKEGAIVIDVTSIKTDSGVVGDVVSSSELEEKLSWLTPVPGGIGPLTIACLLRNFQESYELQTISF